MEERELRITYGMCFKLAGDIVGRLLDTTADHDIKDIVGDVEQLASELAAVAMEGQEEFVSDNSHRVTVTRSPKSSGGYKKQASRGKSSTKQGPRNPNAPASEKQVKLATKLYWEKDHDMGHIDPSSFEEMTMGDISGIIEVLIAADDS
jgi:hypothetical protein